MSPVLPAYTKEKESDTCDVGLLCGLACLIPWKRFVVISEEQEMTKDMDTTCDMDVSDRSWHDILVTKSKHGRSTPSKQITNPK